METRQFVGGPTKALPCQSKGFRIRRPNSSNPDFLQIDLCNEIKKAEFVLIGAGAGFSVDSGLETFRDIANIPQYQERGLSYDDICEPSWLLRDYRLFYGFWGSCYNQYQEALLHSGYHNLISYLRSSKKPFFVLTSNIDGFFARILESNELYEVHGELRYWQCPGPCCTRLYQLDKDFRFQIDASMMCTNSIVDDCTYETDERHNITTVFTASLPRCQLCHMLLRPHVLMFEDSHYIEDEDEWDDYQTLRRSFITKKLLILEFGCGLKVPYIRQEMERVLRRNKRFSQMIRVNPKEVGLQYLSRNNDCRFRIRHVKESAEEFLMPLADSPTETPEKAPTSVE